jgi:hypothetical protein
MCRLVAPEMLCPPAKFEAEVLELESKGAVDRVGAVASDVDVHLGRSVASGLPDVRRIHAPSAALIP